ncbi:hypothetical protein [Terrimonas pollutisoli]|uniref:hypothetical protein n=1 Tax=Terrimonas pollutisoli TaxID=3034147 RepID=UPI0023EC00FB|nr:hypothetical protein [Terrimonas sp. H1YJ31]
MKTLKLLPLFLLSPLVFHAQKSLTGLWVGSLSNDSVTIRKDQSFEIALTEYRQKVYGYSRSSFIVNDTLYYVLKRVKGTVNGDVCEVKDDEIISYNFRGKLDKGVKMTSTFRMNKQDSTWHLEGDWKTNQTKKFYSISGRVELKDEPNYEKSKIFPHLEELKVADEVAFYASSKKSTQQTSPSTNTQPAKKETTIAKAATTKTEKKIDEPAKQEEEVVASAELRKTDLPANKVQVEERKNFDNTLQQPSVSKRELAIKKEEIKPLPQTTVEEPKERNATAITRSESERKIITTDIQKPEIKIPTAAAFVAERKTIAPQVVEFKSDSLELRLYDNGEIDGDTVSILLNGEIILAKQGLKATAIKKTIHMAPGNNEVNLVLYAENLGKYPPNTGLLVVYDGEDIYQVRFSADLQQNAAVIFRRKK